MAALNRLDLARVFWRSLWLQASWSFRDMQGLGLAWTMEPVLRRRYQGEELGRALQRYLGFFNSHPILAAAIIGAAVHGEAEPDRDPVEVDRLRGALMGPYGALGDSFFWGGLKPAVVLVALLAACRGAEWAPWLLAGGFTLLGLGARLWFFRMGLLRGVDVAAAVNAMDLLRRAEQLKRLSAVLAGVFAVWVTAPHRVEAWGIPHLAWLGAAWCGVLAITFFVRRGVGPVWLLGLVASIAAGSLWLT